MKRVFRRWDELWDDGTLRGAGGEHSEPEGCAGQAEEALDLGACGDREVDVQIVGVFQAHPVLDDAAAGDRGRGRGHGHGHGHGGGQDPDLGVVSDQRPANSRAGEPMARIVSSRMAAPGIIKDCGAGFRAAYRLQQPHARAGP